MASAFTASALVFHRTRITDLGISFVDMDLLALAANTQFQYLPLRTNAVILFSIVREELGRINGGNTQVPCLIVDGKPMLESLDIIAFLEKKICET